MQKPGKKQNDAIAAAAGRGADDGGRRSGVPAGERGGYIMAGAPGLISHG